MDVTAAFIAIGIALALGLLVGIQRERSDPALAGIRTFPLITILGVVAALLSGPLGSWVFPAGMLAVAAATAMGNWLRVRSEDSPGITTEIAILVMYCVGGLLWTAPPHLGVAIGVACAVLLHLKATLHGFASRITDADQRAMMQFALITFVVLPVVPDRTFGPFDVLNPRQIWWMVVLVVGIRLAGYVLQKLISGVSHILLGGLLGGVISSTAATASFARQARSSPRAAGSLAFAAAVASSVVFLRLATEIGVVAPRQLVGFAQPLGIMFAGSILGAGSLWFAVRGQAAVASEPGNPTELRSALTFAAIYAGVMLLVAAARAHMGSGGLYAVAVLSGLTDMDAITLSTARLVADGGLDVASGSRVIVLASMSNLVFKLGLAAALGGPAIAKRLAVPVIITLGAGGLALVW